MDEGSVRLWKEQWTWLLTLGFSLNPKRHPVVGPTVLILNRWWGRSKDHPHAWILHPPPLSLPIFWLFHHIYFITVIPQFNSGCVQRFVQKLIIQNFKYKIQFNLNSERIPFSSEAIVCFTHKDGEQGLPGSTEEEGWGLSRPWQKRRGGFPRAKAVGNTAFHTWLQDATKWCLWGLPTVQQCGFHTTKLSKFRLWLHLPCYRPAHRKG